MIKEIVKTSTQAPVKIDTSPDRLIALAVEKGADLDKLEKLLTLRERFEAGEARKAYHIAMAEFKANPPKIDKDKQVGYETSKGKVGYKHASLANVTEKISTELSKHGLSASWTTRQNGNVIVACKITHAKGHSEQTELAAPSDMTGSKNAIQAIGSTITYLERYTLLALTGLATHDQDDDGRASEATNTADFIDNSQKSKILEWLDVKNISEKKFLDFMKVPSLNVVPKSEYKKAIAALEGAKQK